MGSTADPISQVSKCGWQPVEFPLLPVQALNWPLVTVRVVVAGPGLAGRVGIGCAARECESLSDWPRKGFLEWDLSIRGVERRVPPGPPR